MSNLPINEWNAHYYVANKFVCDQILENPVSVDDIVSLNSSNIYENIKHGQIVKFRGMIQDMFDPEYYLKRYTVKNTKINERQMRNGMYMDAATCLKDENEEIEWNSLSNEMASRHGYFVMSTPGLNDWCIKKDIRSVEEIVDTEKLQSKREHADDEVESMDCSETVRKKLKTETSENIDESPNNVENTESILSTEYIMNFPIPIEDGKACIVKVYDEEVSCKLTDVVDVVGFISLDPILNGSRSSDKTIEDFGMQTYNPPVTLVPRLHAIKIFEAAYNYTTPDTSIILSKAESIRSDLHMVLSQILYGDKLAADYLICHLISSIYMRKDQLCLGNYPINITNFPISKNETFTKDLYDFIAQLVAKSHYFECTLENLNDLSMIPKKDNECNRLTSGILQLSKNTHLVIDETGLLCGQLSASGRANYEAIHNLVKFQTVAYNFTYFTKENNADIPVLLLSETKSFIPGITQVPLKIDPETENIYPQVLEAAKQYFRDESRMSDIRDYLQLSTDTNFEFGADITEVIQDDFVALRRTYKNFDADNLHSLMVFARLMSISRGKNFLSIECWKECVEKEVERLQRLPPPRNR